MFKGRNNRQTKKPRCNWYKKNHHQKRKSNDTNTYILTFNSPIIPKEIKIGYTNEKIEQYIPNPLRCFKCKKFGHHGNICNGRPVCGKCRERESNHTTTDCKLNNKCANAGEDHLSYSRTYPVWEKEKEILTIKHSRNLSYPEAWKIVEGYIKKKKPSPKTNESQIVKKKEKNNKELIFKVRLLKPQDWPKFIQEIQPILLKLSTNSTNPQPMAEHSLEKTSQYIETNPLFQPPREEIRTISPHKNQPNPKNLSKESTLSSSNAQNKPLIETEQNQTENKTITEPLNKIYHIKNANQKEPSNQKRSRSSQWSTTKIRIKSKMKSSPEKKKQSEN